MANATKTVNANEIVSFLAENGVPVSVNAKEKELEELLLVNGFSEKDVTAYIKAQMTPRSPSQKLTHVEAELKEAKKEIERLNAELEKKK